MSSVVGRVPPATKRTGQARTHTVPTAAAFRARCRPFFFTLPARRVLCGSIALGVGADCVVDCSEGWCLSWGFCWRWPRRRGWRVKARGGIGSASARSLARAGEASVRHRRHRRGRLWRWRWQRRCLERRGRRGWYGVMGHHGSSGMLRQRAQVAVYDSAAQYPNSAVQ